MTDEEKLSPEKAEQTATAPEKTVESTQEVLEVGIENLSKMVQSAQESLLDIGLILQETLKNAAKVLEGYDASALKSVAEALKETAEALNKMFESEEWHKLEALFPGVTADDFFDALIILGEEYDPEGKPTIDGYFKLFRELSQSLPYIPTVLEAYKKESGLQEITLFQFLDNKNPATGEPAESLFSKCLQQAAGPDFMKKLPILKGVVPESYIITNDIVSNSMTKGLVNAGSVSLDPSHGHKGKYKVYAAITLDPNKYAVNGSFTKYDRRVFNGICSLIAAGNDTFTAETVFRAMNGLSNSEKVTSQQEGAVTKSINKMRDIEIRINVTEEFKARRIIDKDADVSIEYEDKCLKVGKLTVKAGGRTKTGFKVTEKPLLYDYAERLNQIISIPSEMLTIKDESGGRISNTDNFSATKEYLLQRIEIMKSQKRRGRAVNTVIDINTFYEETDNNSASGNYKTPAAKQTAVRKKKLKAREQAAQCLDYWTRTKYINGYRMTEKKHVVAAIEIQL